MAQGVSRVKQRIRASGLPFVMPTGDEWTERLRSVLHVLYVVSNEGYAATAGPRVARSDDSAAALVHGTRAYRWRVLDRSASARW